MNIWIFIQLVCQIYGVIYLALEILEIRLLN